MKILLCLLLSGVSLQIIAGNHTNITRMAGTCRVWGLMKYYHPDIARKKINWDMVFVNAYDSLKTVSTFEVYNKHLKIMILRSGIKPRNFSSSEWVLVSQINNGKINRLNGFQFLQDTNKFSFREDFLWIKNDDLFSGDVQQLLYQVLLDFKPLKSKYIKGRIKISHDEDPLNKLDSVSEPYRMLGLFRYWNIIEYFFPYKKLADKSWDSVLVEYIPKFQKYGNYYNYYFACKQLSTETDDSHAWSMTINYPPLGKLQKQVPGIQRVYFYPPVSLVLVDSMVVIGKVLDEFVKTSGTVRQGDVLLKVNDKDVSRDLADLRKFTPLSNESSFVDEVKWNLVSYMTDTGLFRFTLLRGADTISVAGIRGMTYQQYHKPVEKNNQVNYTVKDSIGYINLCEINTRHLKKALRSYKNYPAIIFDMRGYPSGVAPLFLPRFLSRRPKDVGEYFHPYKRCPGAFRLDRKPENYYIENNLTLLLKLVINIRGKISPTFRKPYAGKIVLLIDEEAISGAETMCMLLKAYAQNLCIVGRPTSGANGDVIDFYLPGGIRTSFSSLDWHFPDGRQLQRIGILPDIEVRQSIESVRKGNDIILERAIQFVTEGR